MANQNIDKKDIAKSLYLNGSFTQEEIAEKVGMSTSAVSHQLRVLRSIKLVKGRKEGKEVRYSLDDDHVTSIMQCGLAHVNED